MAELQDGLLVIIHHTGDQPFTELVMIVGQPFKRATKYRRDGIAQDDMLMITVVNIADGKSVKRDCFLADMGIIPYSPELGWSKTNYTLAAR